MSLEERQKQFKPGSIRRIKLHNFLTYADVECFPGPRLNVVIGPNGTGKSTILCAICLGLGGQPDLLGRADDARTFIMNEKDIAIIEIELAPFPNNPTHVIKRTIDRNKGSTGKKSRGIAASTYEINGQVVKLEQVKKLVSETYRIAIDNLCTFLPQDRVGSFSGFDSKQLLKETELSVSASGHLWETHQKLMQLEEEMQNSHFDLETARAELNRLEQEVKRLEREKALMEEREECVQKLQLYEKKMLWVKFEEKRLAALEMKEQRKQVKDRLKVAQQGMAPLMEEIGRLEHEYDRGKHQRVALARDIEQFRKLYENSVFKAEKHQDALDGISNELSAVDSMKRNAEKVVQNREEQVREILSNLNSYPSEEEIVEKVKAVQEELRGLKHEMNLAKREVINQQNILKEAKSDYEHKLRRFNSMKDDKARRNEKIFASDQDLKNAFEWVNSNRKLFRRPVHGPIVCEVVTNDFDASNYLEQHVKNTVLKSFVVECREDMNLLYREIRQKRGWRINIQVVNQGTLEPVRRMYSEEKMNNLKDNHGILGYLDEMFEASPAVLQALRNTSNVQSVLVGGARTKMTDSLLAFLSQRENASGKQAFCIFVKDAKKTYKHTATVSRYNAESISISVDEIRPARMLSPGVPQEEKSQAERDLKAAEEECQNMQPRLAEAQKSFERLQLEAQQLSLKFKDAKQGRADYQQQKERLESAKRKVAEAKREASKDNRAEKKRLIRQIRDHISSYTMELEKASSAYNDYLDSCARQAGVKMSEGGLISKKQQLQDQLETMQQQTVHLEQEYNRLNNTFTLVRQQVLELKQLADNSAPIGTDDNPTPLREKLDEITADKTELEDLIYEAKEKIGRIINNPAVIRHYEELKEKFDDQTKRLEDLADTNGGKSLELKNLKEPYLAALTNIVHKVNTLFEVYMQELGCAGQVALHKGPNSSSEGEQRDNFKEWGIQIKVLFRSESTLQVLSARVHSGGERSVSTIMYLMAMQELMVSPFRCVDEINQGLDERNERLVFRRIVENSTRKPLNDNDPSSHCGQYFLITPKLLPNLTDMENEDVTVHCIFNGPRNFDHFSDWNIDSLLSMRKHCIEDDGKIPAKKARIEEKKDEE